MIQEVRLDCAGLQLAGLRLGEGPRRVLALHGWLDNAASFVPLGALPHELELVAIDLPGHGRSDWLAPHAEYHYVDWVAWVDRILDALGWTECSLLGHSMGAGISALYAGALPDRVERLVLLDGLGPFTNRPETAPENLARALKGRRRVEPRSPRVHDSIDAAVERKLHALPYMSDEAARLLVERGTRAVDDGVVFSHDPRLVGRSLVRFTEPQVLAFLRSITAPTLVIRPSDSLDYPGDHGDAEQRLHALDAAELLRVDGHHHVHLTHPERCSRVLEFLAA